MGRIRHELEDFGWESLVAARGRSLVLPTASYLSPLLRNTIAGVAGQSKGSIPGAKEVCRMVVDMWVEVVRHCIERLVEDRLGLRRTGHSRHSFGYLRVIVSND